MSKEGDNSLAEQLESEIKYWFKISYNGTPSNKEVHERFKRFCEVHTDNGYLMGIKYLLDYFDSGVKFEDLLRRIIDLEQKMALLEERINNPEGVSDDHQSGGVKVFGGGELR